MGLDPYPFGGGVTILESLAVSTPVLTLPGLQTVPALADGMVTTIAAGSEQGLEHESDISLMTVDNVYALVESAQEIVRRGAQYREIVARTAWRIFDDDEAAESWGAFFVRAHTMMRIPC